MAHVCSLRQKLIKNFLLKINNFLNKRNASMFKMITIFTKIIK